MRKDSLRLWAVFEGHIPNFTVAPPGMIFGSLLTVL